MKQNNKKLGGFGEREAARYLRKKGYQRVAANYSCQYGEVDLIVQKPGILVFAEVKTRSNDRFAAPAEAVGAAKQQRIIKAAGQYLQHSPFGDSLVRFDVVEVLPAAGGWQIHCIQHAFEAD